MKQTPDDLQFANEFARALGPLVSAERRKGRSFRGVADDLGITEPALKKCLSGRNTPSLRTVVLAFERYGVAIPYSGIAFVGREAAKKKQRRKTPTPSQLVLPFEIKATGPSDDRLNLKLTPTGVQSYQLQVTLHLAK